MNREAISPDSERDWQAIDIFVFSNGQQYSPPRKYHLLAEDINLWKSTLNFLAKTQYGPFHSTVDLYTLEGRRICDPLQLSNGGSYVAVQPPESFIEAGYDKYLIKASRSWEKRKAKINENSNEVGETTKHVSDVDNIGIDVKSVEEKVALKSRASSIANHDVSTIIKPHLLPTLQGRPVSTSHAKQPERKKASIQSPLVIRKITPTLLPTTNLKTSFSKKKSMTPAVIISKPEERKRLSYTPCSSVRTANKLSPRLSNGVRPPSKPKRTEVILPKVQEDVCELKTSSSIKVTSTITEKILPTDSADLKVVIEDKELNQASKLYHDPQFEMSSIFVNPSPRDPLCANIRLSTSRDIPLITVPIQSVVIEPVRQTPITTIVGNPNGIPESTVHINRTIVDDSNGIPESAVHIKDADNKIIDADNSENLNHPMIITESSINIQHNIIKNSVCKTMAIEKVEDLSVDKYLNNIQHIAQTTEENTNLLNSEEKIIIPIINDNSLNHNSPPKRRSIRVELPDNQTKLNYVTNKLEESLSSGIIVSTSKNSETVEIQDNRSNSNFVTNKIEESFLINSEIIVRTRKSNETIKVYNSSPLRSASVSNREIDSQYVAHKVDEAPGLPPKVVDKTLNDQYKATLKRGDVVNFKLNIEIENHGGIPNTYTENLGSNSVTIIQSDKGSQSNIDDQIIAQNKSLLTLIMEVFKNYYVEDDQHDVIILQYKTCQYCNDFNAANPDNEVNKNFVILLPIEQFEEMKERCQCDKKQPEIQVASFTNAVKTSQSCTSADKVTKPMETPANTATQNICATDKSNENIILVSRKKSIATNNESTHSNIDIKIKTELVTVSVESMTMTQNTGVENSSTQTDWCDVLLEAKHLDDGHYTFRLPPIELLKHYKLT